MRITTAFLALLPGMLVAQTPYFGAVDQGLEWGTPWLMDASLGADGHISVLERAIPEGLIPYEVYVTAFSFEDGVLWRKKLLASDGTGADPMRIIRLANGESLVLGQFSGPGMVAQDQFILRLGADGSNLGAATFHLADATEDDPLGFGSSLNVLPDGSIAMSMDYTLKPVFVHWSGGSTVDWARSYIPNTVEPLKKCPAFDLLVLQDGGLLLTMKASTVPYLVRLDADGEVQWSRHYPGVPVEGYAARELANGDILIAGARADFPCVARLSAQGDLLWLTHLATEQVDWLLGNGFKRIRERSNGDLILGVDSHILGAPDHCGAVRLRANGEALQAWALPQQYGGGLGLVTLVDDQAVMVGHVVMPIANENHHVISISRSDLLAGIYCLLQNDPVTSTDVPVLPLPLEGSTIEDREVIVGTLEFTSEDLTLPVITTCITHDGLLEAAPVGSVLVLPSLVERGGDILIQLPPHKGPVTAEVLDMAGRVVRRPVAPSGLDRLALTMDMDAGSYAVQLKDASGKLIGSGRVIVR